MTEAEWLNCGYSYDMLDQLAGKASDRKLRLFASACCRALWHFIVDSNCRNAVEMSERFADKLTSAEELEEAARRSPPGRPSGGSWAPVRLSFARQARRAVLATCQPVAQDAAWETARQSMALIQNLQAHILRDIFGNPFRPAVLDPAWLRWRDGFIPQVAQSIYDERRFADLPILGDALEDAGCTNIDILDHCHRPGEHVRGCWVLDLLLGKQ